MLHLGTVPASSTLYIPFATYNADGASVTMTGLAVTDIEIYKNGSVTQRSSDAGYTLLDTDGIDFDAITGIHGFSIDLADNTDAGFYTVGAFYWVVVASVTVATQTVNFVAATFRIGPAEGVTGYQPVDVAAISADATAANNLEADYDGTGYAKANSTIGTCTTNTDMRGTNSASTHAAADVWAVATRALTDKAGFALTATTGLGNQTANITGDLSGSVGSVTGAVGSVTGAVTVGTNNDKTDYALTSAERTSVAAAIWDRLTSALVTVGSIGKLLVDNVNAAISSRSSHSAADVWAVATRALTDKTGFAIGVGGIAANAFAANAIDSAALATSAANEIRDTIISDATAFAGASIAAIKAQTDLQPAGIKKNAALAGFSFLMRDSTTGNPKTLLTVTGQRSIDGGAFAGLANAVTEIAHGLYKVDLAAADTNGDVIVYRFTAVDAKDTVITVKTNP